MIYTFLLGVMFVIVCDFDWNPKPDKIAESSYCCSFWFTIKYSKLCETLLISTVSQEVEIYLKTAEESKWCCRLSWGSLPVLFFHYNTAAAVATIKQSWQLSLTGLSNQKWALTSELCLTWISCENILPWGFRLYFLRLPSPVTRKTRCVFNGSQRSHC